MDQHCELILGQYRDKIKTYEKIKEIILEQLNSYVKNTSTIVNSVEARIKTEKSFYCTRGMSFVYIDVDMAADQNVCIPREEYLPVSLYHIKREPQLCHKDSCTLSGDISVALRKEELDFL